MLIRVGFLTFLLSLILCLILIILSRKSKNLLDDTNGVQKVHKGMVPRVGGLAIFISFSAAMALYYLNFKDSRYLLIIVGALPIVIAGLYEDIKKKLTPQVRLGFSFFSALLAILLLDASIQRTGIFFLDYLVRLKIIAIIFALIAIAGIINAINIIDGLNGLSSGTCMIFLGAIGYVAFKYQNFYILQIVAITGTAILGFFIWNYPYGRIFLGDGGAYFIGFILAVTSIMLVNSTKEISPLFPILILIYPIFETLFSIYRRRILKKRSALVADHLHLHSLFYRRIVPYIFSNGYRERATNSETSPFLWILCTFSVVPAVYFSDINILVGITTVIFILIYITLYRCIVKFKIGKLFK